MTRVSTQLGELEVAVWFAGELASVSNVRAGGRYQIGSAADVDFAVELAVDRWPLVDHVDGDVVVRDPASTKPHRLAHGDVVHVAIGAVRFRVSTARPVAAVPRARVEKRPYGFGAGSLAVHLAIVLLAGWLATPDPEPPAKTPGEIATRGTPARIARFSLAARTVERAPKPEPASTPIQLPPTPVVEPVKPVKVTRAVGAGDQIKPRVPDELVQEPRPAPADSRNFDPSSDPRFDTVKTGSYSTVATGRSAGSDYKLLENGERSRLVVVKCDSSACVVVGGDQAPEIRAKLQRRLPEIVACYQRSAETAGKEVELDFGIDPQGKVGKLQVGGVGDAGTCVADIINSIQFQAD